MRLVFKNKLEILSYFLYIKRKGGCVDKLKFKDIDEFKLFFAFLCKHFPRAIEHNFEMWKSGKSGSAIVGGKNESE